MMSLITLFSSFHLASAAAPTVCADFSGVYKAISEPSVPTITMSQQQCNTLHFAFDKQDLVFHLDAQSRMLKNDTLIKVVQSGKINKKFMMIFLTVEYFDTKGSHHKESVILFEKSASGDVFVTFTGDVPDQIVASRRYQLTKQ